MKKRTTLVLVLILFLCGCGKAPLEELPGSSAGIPDAHEGPALSGESMAVVEAKNGFCSDGTLYYIQDGWLRYAILQTGRGGILCFDPLCLHDEVTSETTCPALSRMGDFESRVLVHDGCVWFTARTVAANIGDPEYVQLRCLDLETMKLDIYLKNNELPILDFWFCGKDLYLSLPSPVEQNNGGVSLVGGSLFRLERNGKLTLAVEDKDETQLRLLGSGAGFLYYGGKYGDGTIWRTAPDFTYTETAAILGNAIDVQFHGDTVYYQKATGNYVTLEVPDVGADYDNESSIVRGGAAEAALCRQKLDGYSEEEILYASMPLPMNNAAMNRRNYIFDDTGLIWLTPLDVTYEGCVIWLPDIGMMQMGAAGQNIVTGFFSVTNGRVIALEPNTLEIVQEYDGLGVDILDFYAVENGQIMGYFEAINPAVREEKGTGSAKTVLYSGVVPVE